MAPCVPEGASLGVFSSSLLHRHGGTHEPPFWALSWELKLVALHVGVGITVAPIPWCDGWAGLRRAEPPRNQVLKNKAVEQ